MIKVMWKISTAVPGSFNVLAHPNMWYYFVFITIFMVINQLLVFCLKWPYLMRPMLKFDIIFSGVFLQAQNNFGKS